jgi:hypothetical protein
MKNDFYGLSNIPDIYGLNNIWPKKEPKHLRLKHTKKRKTYLA